MSLYNTLHGQNKDTDLLLGTLDLSDVARFRDIYLNADGTKIILYTRTGGENRKAYSGFFETIRKHPCYIGDYDDDFDKTYAYIEFKIPKRYQEVCKTLATGEEPETIHEKFEKTLNELKSMSAVEVVLDKRFKPMMEMFNKLSDPNNTQTIYEV